jgi:acetyltransferase-like isoleucine patch superfamily enzyme
MSVGKDFRIGFGSTLKPACAFSIGNNFFSGPYGYFSSNKETAITIGSDVMFGPHCKVIGGNHNTSWPGGPMVRAPFLGPGKGIVIEDDVWIGAGATLLDGAHVAEGSVIAAGAIVTGYIGPYCVAAGVPAKVIKQRMGDNSLSDLLRVKRSKYSLADVKASLPNS